MTLNGEKRRTRAIKRGGQHPEWDEEVRFTLFEDTEDMLARSAKENAAANGTGTPPPVPSKEKKRKKVKGGNSMLLACFADDPKEPELIGETMVDLSEVLTKGETDGTCLFTKPLGYDLKRRHRLVCFKQQRQVQWGSLLGAYLLVKCPSFSCMPSPMLTVAILGATSRKEEETSSFHAKLWRSRIVYACGERK